jgi:hypothetical protein
MNGAWNLIGLGRNYQETKRVRKLLEAQAERDTAHPIVSVDNARVDWCVSVVQDMAQRIATLEAEVLALREASRKDTA